MRKKLVVSVLSTMVALSATVVAIQPTAHAVEPAPLHGWVDMHAHPMGHLAFGGKLIHGAPDLGVLMSAIPSGNGCRHFVAPVDRTEASWDDRAIHGGWAFDNTCGDILRREFIRGLEDELGGRVAHRDDGAWGWPLYNSFPAHDDLTHQQMWVDWIRRAYSEGGLRVMTALAVNNRTLAAAVTGAGDRWRDDVSSAEVQIEQMKVMVDNHAWMEVAYTSEDLRRIVGEDRLAIVLGVEIDNIGNMEWDPTVQESGDAASVAAVRTHLEDLWDQGVRYIFPVHVVDNKLGNAAIYENQFNVSNFHQTGEFWDITCAPAGSGITHLFEIDGFDLAYAIIKLKIGIDPFREPPPLPSPPCSGHINNGGLTQLGKLAVEEMMRMGMLIDVDHMSTLALQNTLEIAEEHGYPINAGHNSPRALTAIDANENEKTLEDYRRIADLGGIVGLGSTDKATNFVRNYQFVSSVVSGMQLAIGTDANGMVILPDADPAAAVPYDSTFTRASDGSQTWDISVDGVANYGLFADYVKTWPSVGMTPAEEAAFFSTAEGFARMWDQANVAAAGMIPTPPTADAGGPYTVDEGDTLELDASGTTDPNQPAETLEYAWDFNGDTFHDDASGATPTYVAGDGPAVVTVGLLVTDDDAMTDTATASITIDNVAPSATLVQLPPLLVFQGLTATFQFTGVSDPGVTDMAAGFSFSVDCTDDGVVDVAWSASDTALCTYPLAGSFTVRGAVRDKDGGIGEATTTVEVLSPSEAADAIAAVIEGYRDAGSLNGGQANALLVKLRHAKELFEAGRIRQALRQLDVLLNQVEVYGRTGVLTETEAAELALLIERLIESIREVA